MRRMSSRIVALILMLTIIVTPISVKADDASLLDEFVDQVFLLDRDARQEFVDLLDMFLTVDDPNGIADAYGDAFTELTVSQQGRLLSFGVTVDAVAVLVKYVDEEQFAFENLNTYLGLDGSIESPVDFRAALASRQTEFEADLAAIGADITALKDGFSRMAKIFDLLHDTRLLNIYGLSIPFLETTVAYGDFTLNREKAGIIIEIANDQLADEIDMKETAINALDEFVTYYNDSTGADRTAMYDYLHRYGFVKVNTPTPPGPPALPPTTTIGEDEIPLGLSELADPEFVENTIDIIKASSSLEDIMLLLEQIMAIVNDPLSPITEHELMNAFKIIKVAQEVIDDTESLEIIAGYIGDVTKRLAIVFMQFTDIDDFKWAEGFIEFLAVSEIINGKTDILFAPADYITRAEFVALIVRMYKLEDKGGDFLFTDVVENDWYYDEIKIAYSQGIIDGKSATIFDPMASITRQEIAKVLATTMELLGDYVVNLELELPFSDKDDIADWALLGVMLAYQEEIITGYPDKSFGPTDKANRAEAATMIYKLYIK